MATGENSGTWGTKTNTNLELVQQAIAGVQSITLSSGSTTALVMSNASISTARNMVIKFASVTLSGATTNISNVNVTTAKIADNAVTAAKLQRKFTISTSSPSGGSDGDIWFKYS